MKFNPRHEHFSKVITTEVDDMLVAWEGDCWRFQDADFPSAKEILNGEGARLNGGRLNVRGSFPVVYGSLSDETALKESKARAKRYGLEVRKPRVFVCIHLKLRRVLDLTQDPIRRSLGVTLKILREEDWEKLQDSGIEALSQALGRAAHGQGAEAIVIPSFAHRGGTNVAFFPRNLTKGRMVKIYEEDTLLTKQTNKRKK